MTIKTFRILSFLVISGVALLGFQFLQWRLYNLPDINSDDPKLLQVQMVHIAESGPAYPSHKNRPSRTGAVKGRSLEGSRNAHLPVPGMKLDLGIAPKAMAEPKVKGLPQPFFNGHKILEMKKRDTSEQLSRHPGQVKKTDQDPGKSMNENKIKKTVKHKIHMENVHDLHHKQMDNDSSLKDKKLSDQIYPTKRVKGRELQVPMNRTRLAAKRQYANQNDLALHKSNDQKDSSYFPKGRSYDGRRKNRVKGTRQGRAHRTNTYKKPLVIVSGPTEVSETDRKRLKA